MSELVEVLQELGVPYVEAGEHGHTTVGWVNVDCPNCSPGSGRFRCGFHLGSHACNCWSCGRLNGVDVLAELASIGWGQARTLLKTVDRPFELHVERPKGKLQLPPGVGPLLQQHSDYLVGREYDPDELTKLWGIQGIGLSSKLPWRIFIPIHYRGEMVSWTTRATADGFGGRRRYVAAKPTDEAIPHKHLLYGADYCRHAIVVVEGPADVWRIGPGAAATFGLQLTSAQINKISQYAVRVVAFDNSSDAQRTARRLCELLEALPGQTYRVVLSSKDPGMAGPAEVKELRQRFLESSRG